MECTTLRKAGASSEWRLVVDDLTFLSKLGFGTSAQVFKGIVTRLYRNREVAIKIISSRGSKIIKSSKSELAFEHECRIMKRLGSAPNIVEFKASCRRPQICIVTEYCRFGSLYHLLNNEGIDVSWSRTFKWLREIVMGINQLHSHSPPIYHRDLKSLNLLVTNDLVVKVCDFGLSRLAESTNLSTLMKLRGTYHYTAPELYHVNAFTERSDIYSIGIIMWELVRRCITGKYMRPFGEYKFIVIEYSIIIKAAKENLRPTLLFNTPPELAALIKRCWSAKPEDRPTCEEILRELDRMERDYAENRRDWDEIRDVSLVRPGSEEAMRVDTPLDDGDQEFIGRFLEKYQTHKERKEKGEESASSEDEDEEEEEEGLEDQEGPGDGEKNESESENDKKNERETEPGTLAAAAKKKIESEEQLNTRAPSLTAPLLALAASRGSLSAPLQRVSVESGSNDDSLGWLASSSSSPASPEAARPAAVTASRASLTSRLRRASESSSDDIGGLSTSASARAAAMILSRGALTARPRNSADDDEEDDEDDEDEDDGMGREQATAMTKKQEKEMTMMMDGGNGAGPIAQQGKKTGKERKGLWSLAKAISADRLRKSKEDKALRKLRKEEKKREKGK